MQGFCCEVFQPALIFIRICKPVYLEIAMICRTLLVMYIFIKVYSCLKNACKRWAGINYLIMIWKCEDVPHRRVNSFHVVRFKEILWIKLRFLLIEGCWSERSPGGGNGNLLQYSCLENPIDREAWRATVHGVAKTRSLLRARACTHTFSLSFSSLSGCIVLLEVWNGSGISTERIHTLEGSIVETWGVFCGINLEKCKLNHLGIMCWIHLVTYMANLPTCCLVVKSETKQLE